MRREVVGPVWRAVMLVLVTWGNNSRGGLGKEACYVVKS
jgi:hypothetical protein